MQKLLDPGRLDSGLTKEAIYNKADEISKDTSLLSELSTENISALVVRVMADINEASAQDIRATLVHIIIARCCIRQLMADSYGRSEYHIAGEVCRIVNAIRSIALLEKITDLKELTDTATPTTNANPALWFPDGVIYPCPTIDSREADTYRMVADKHGRLTITPSLHSIWLGVCLNDLLPSLKAEYLTQLQPPFELEGGEIVAQDTPVFYIATDRLDTVEPEPPRTLVYA